MGDGVSAPSPDFTSHTEIFETEFPKYLLMGMTYEQFWEMDPTLTIAYREADRLRQERVNEQAWLNGYYVYEALGAISPILHAFAKAGTKPRAYRKPLDLQLRKRKDGKPTAAEKQTTDAGKSIMRAFMSQINKKFSKKEVGAGVEHGSPGASNPG